MSNEDIERNRLAEVLEAISWAQSATNARWEDKNDYQPTRNDAWILDAYFHAALAASDVDEFIMRVISGNSALMDWDWRGGHPASRFSRVKHANLVAHTLGKKCTGSKIPIPRSLLQEYTQEALSVAVPEADELIENRETIELLGEERVFASWGKAYSTALWALNATKDARSLKLSEKAIQVFSEDPGRVKVLEAIAYGVPSLIELKSATGNEGKQASDCLSSARKALIDNCLMTLEDCDKHLIAGTLALLSNSEEVFDIEPLLAASEMLRVNAGGDGRETNLSWATARFISALNSIPDSKDIEKYREQIFRTLLMHGSLRVWNILHVRIEEFKKLWSKLSNDCRFLVINSIWDDLDLAEMRDEYAMNCIQLVQTLGTMDVPGVHDLNWRRVIDAAPRSRLYWLLQNHSQLLRIDEDSEFFNEVCRVLELAAKSDSIGSREFKRIHSEYLADTFLLCHERFADNAEDVLFWVKNGNSDNVHLWVCFSLLCSDSPINECEPILSTQASVELIEEFYRNSSLGSVTNFGLSDSNIRRLLPSLRTTDAADTASFRYLFEGQTGSELEWSIVPESLSIASKVLLERTLERWHRTDPLKGDYTDSISLADKMEEMASRIEDYGVRDTLLSSARYIKQWSQIAWRHGELEHLVLENAELSSNAKANSRGTIVKLPDSDLTQSRFEILDTVFSGSSENADNYRHDTQNNRWRNDSLLKESLDFPETADVKFMNTSWWAEAKIAKSTSTQRNESQTEYFIVTKYGANKLDGTSPIIHKTNALCSMSLDESNVLSYLQFFCAFVHGDAGPFYLLRSLDDSLVLGKRHKLTGPMKRFINAPRYLGRDLEGRFVCTANVLYGDAIFYADFLVNEVGLPEMLSDSLLFKDTGLTLQFYAAKATA